MLLDKQGIELALELAVKGEDYSDIGKILTKNGYRTKRGLEMDCKHVSAILVNAGFQKKSYPNRKKSKILKTIATKTSYITSKESFVKEIISRRDLSKDLKLDILSGILK